MPVPRNRNYTLHLAWHASERSQGYLWPPRPRTGQGTENGWTDLTIIFDVHSTLMSVVYFHCSFHYLMQEIRFMQMTGEHQVRPSGKKKVLLCLKNETLHLLSINSLTTHIQYTVALQRQPYLSPHADSDTQDVFRYRPENQFTLSQLNSAHCAESR